VIKSDLRTQTVRLLYRYTLAIFLIVAALSFANLARAQSVSHDAQNVEATGIQCALLARGSVGRGEKQLTGVDRCLSEFLSELDRLEPTDEYNIASEAMLYFPCFGLGARKDRIVQASLHAAQKMNDFDAAISALFNRGVCYWNDKPAQFAKAMEKFQPFRDALAPYVNPTALDSPERLNDQAFAFREMGRRYVRFLENTNRIDRGGTLCGSKPNRCVIDAWTLAQRLKARMFHARMLQVMTNKDKTGELIKLIEKQYALVQAQESIRIGLKPFAPGLSDDPGEIERETIEVNQAIRAKSPEYARFYQELAPSLQEIKDALSDNEVYVSYFFSDTDRLTDGRDRNIIAFKIAKVGDPVMTLLPIGNMEVKEFTTKIDEGIVQDVPLTNLKPLLDQIGAALIGSLHLAPQSRVIIEADESLADFPFALATVDGKPLYTRNNLTYVPSAGVFLDLRRNRSRVSASHLYAGFGRATFGAGTPNLSEVKAEIDQAAEIFGRDAAYKNSEAKESDFYRQSELLFRAHVIHLATHTDWTGSEFALVFHEGDGEDGLLKESDIVGRIRTSADLVVLSGCDTARLDSESNLPGEAFSSITRAFFAVGAKRLLVTQWQVRDEAARTFVTDFMKSYAKSGNADQSLILAQEQMRNHPSATPKDWAGWVLVGD
jgi:CHAT domain